MRPTLPKVIRNLQFKMLGETMQCSFNILLLSGAIFSAVAALFHFACIIWGAPLFRIMGAGEPMVSMAAKGHWYPTFLAVAVGTMLLIWAAYALSGAGMIMQLPYLKIILSAITCIYLLRAITFPILKPVFPGNSDTFWWVSSTICLIVGLLHLFGLLQVWGKI